MRKYVIENNILPATHHIILVPKRTRRDSTIIPVKFDRYVLLLRNVHLFSTHDIRFPFAKMFLFHSFLKTYETAFSEIYKLYSITKTIPVLSAACEGTFSCLKRIKN